MKRMPRPDAPVTAMLEGSQLSETWVLCFVANRFIDPMYRAIEAASGLSRPEFVVLLSVGHFDGLVAQDVADMSGLPRNTISRGVHRLLDAGLLVRAAAKGGTREQALRLTAEGAAEYSRLLDYPARRRAAMLNHITARERETLERILLKLAIAAPEWAEVV
jgi:MarR family transcriptional regulator, temperature-dependent positive regulator of motility